MYEKHFGFVQKPFSILPDGSFLYRSKTHNHALTLLEYGLLTGVELMVITGNIGCGKTTLIRYLLDQVPADVDVGLISNPHPPYTDLLKWVLLSFDLDYRDEDKTNQHIAFMEFLLQQHKNNRRALLIVDEAHNFQWETIHQLMTLCNINAEKGLVIQLMLFGLGELDKTLRHPKLTQYAYRLGIRSRIESLDEKATKEYVTHRIKVAGGSESLFQQDCYPRIFHYTQGTPRLINILCDTALAYAYAEQQEQVTQNNVEEVVRDKHGALLKFHNVPYQQRPPALREDTAPTDSTSRLSIPQLIIAKKQTAARKHATEGEGRLPSRLSSAASTRPPANEREKHEPDKPIKLHGTQSVAIKTNREGENKSQALKSDSVSRAAAQRVSRKNPIRQRHGGGPGSVQKPTEKRPIHESANVERSTKPAIQKSRTALNLPNRKVSSVAAIVLTMLVAGLILKLRNTPDSTIHTPPSAGADSVTQQENIATANIQALQDDSIGDPEPSAIAQATLRDQTDNLNATTTTETTPTAELQEQRVVVRHDLKSIELIPDSANDGAVLVRAAARQTKPYSLIPLTFIDPEHDPSMRSLVTDITPDVQGESRDEDYIGQESLEPDDQAPPPVAADIGISTEVVVATVSQTPTINVEQLLGRAESLMRRQRLTSPEDQNALEIYKTILGQYPDNEQARDGVRTIAETYIKWAVTANATGDLKKSENYYLRALEVNPTASNVVASLQLVRQRMAEDQNARGRLQQLGIDRTRQTLITRVKNGDSTAVSLLLDAGLSPNTRDQYGFTLLMLAAIKGYLDIAEELLTTGADINARSDDGRTALIAAAWNGNDEIVKLLLSTNAAIDATSDEGWTALSYATMKGHDGIVSMLLAKGADPTIRDLYGATALSIAKKGGHSTIVRLISQSNN